MSANASDSDSDNSGTLELSNELSAATLAALNAHLAEADSGTGADGRADGGDKGAGSGVKENYGLSQFWYDDETTDAVAHAALAAAGERGRIGLLSAPTAMEGIEKLAPSRRDVYVFEYDRRFETRWGQDRFVFYDCHAPLVLPAALCGSFDFLLADPPYLNEDVLANFAASLRALAKGSAEAVQKRASPGALAGTSEGTEVASGAVSTDALVQPPAPSPVDADDGAGGDGDGAGFGDCVVMLITGAVLAPAIRRTMGLKPLRRRPAFQCKLSNQFYCYANRELDGFGGFMPDEEFM